jgi:ribulose-bisphosphate carboxylase large chain
MAWLSATYSIASTAADIRRRAEALALEQSVEVPLEAVVDPRIRGEVVARVQEVEPEGDGRFRVVLGIATETTGPEVAQLVNMLFGNCSLQEDVRLMDVDLPPSVAARMGGPGGGIEGLRAAIGAGRRALTATALKPQGSSPAELAELCRTFALAGIDLVKDDHGLADQRYAPFEQRVAACQRAAQEASAQSGRTTLYAPSLVGGPTALHRQAEFALERGVRIVLIAPMLVGLATFHELVETFPDLLFLAHPAFGGTSRISPVWLFGRFFRLLGADAVIFPNHGGRFSYSAQECAGLAEAARCPWGSIRPALPVPAGGMTLDRVDELLEFYGDDVMLLIGGALLGAGMRLAERSREFVEKVAGA